MTTTFDKPSIDETLNHYWQLLEPHQKQSVLAMLKTFVDVEKIPNETFLAEYNNDINEALREYDRGEYISHEEIEKNTWLLMRNYPHTLSPFSNRVLQ